MLLSIKVSNVNNRILTKKSRSRSSKSNHLKSKNTSKETTHRRLQHWHSQLFPPSFQFYFHHLSCREEVCTCVLKSHCDDDVKTFNNWIVRIIINGRSHSNAFIITCASPLSPWVLLFSGFRWTSSFINKFSILVLQKVFMAWEKWKIALTTLHTHICIKSQLVEWITKF